MTNDELVVNRPITPIPLRLQFGIHVGIVFQIIMIFEVDVQTEFPSAACEVHGCVVAYLTLNETARIRLE